MHKLRLYTLPMNDDGTFLVFVVANDRRGIRQLVTVYRFNRQFRALPDAA